MPGSDKSGDDGKGRGHGPWGSGPRLPPGQRPTRPIPPEGPDLEDLLRAFRDRLGIGRGGGDATSQPPRRSGGVSGRLVALILAAGWLLSGVYVVDEGERAVVLRLGTINRTVGPGLHAHMPWPIESRRVRNVTNLRTELIGCTSQNNGDCNQDVPGESLMVTGDRNVVEIHFKVNYVISSLPDFLFNVQDPEGSVGAVAESAMREVIGQRQLSAVMTENRTEVARDVAALTQRILNSYSAGVRIVQVQLLSVQPPPDLTAAFNDVVKARQDAVSARNVATRYANEVVPRARGEAAQIVQEAEAYRARVVHEATGEAARFDSVYAEYRRAPRVTRDRLYTETMERVFARANTVILDSRGGAVTYLPLDGMIRRNNGQPQPVTPPRTQSQQQQQGTP